MVVHKTWSSARLVCPSSGQNAIKCPFGCPSSGENVIKCPLGCTSTAENVIECPSCGQNAMKCPFRVPFQWRKHYKLTSRVPLLSPKRNKGHISVPFHWKKHDTEPLGFSSSGENVIKCPIWCPSSGQNLVRCSLFTIKIALHSAGRCPFLPTFFSPLPLKHPESSIAPQSEPTSIRQVFHQEFCSYIYIQTSFDSVFILKLIADDATWCHVQLKRLNSKARVISNAFIILMSGGKSECTPTRRQYARKYVSYRLACKELLWIYCIAVDIEGNFDYGISCLQTGFIVKTCNRICSINIGWRGQKKRQTHNSYTDIISQAQDVTLWERAKELTQE